MFDTSGVVDETLIDVLRDTEARIAAAQADAIAITAELYARCPDWITVSVPGLPDLSPVEVTAAEIGPALALSKLVATDRVELAVTATARLPRSLAALGRGQLSLGKLRILLEHTAELSPEQVATVEERVLPRAERQTPSVFGALVRRTVIRIDSAGACARVEEATRGRGVELYPAADEMATLRATLPAPQALRAYQLLSAAARAGKQAAAEGDQRSMDARRVDALVDCLERLDPDRSPVDPDEPAAPDQSRPQPARPARPRWHTGPVNLHLTVPWTTLAGLSDEPGELDGYGPLTADAVRSLAQDATWRRILTDPASGTVLDVGTTSYHPPAGLDDHIRTRDRTCRFPGCRRSARRADLDHAVPFPNGPTAKDNLAALCRSHHRLKTLTTWRVRHLGQGRLEWTSPTGQTYTTEPPPAHPPGNADDDEPGHSKAA